jgi:hypothetical protein
MSAIHRLALVVSCAVVLPVVASVPAAAQRVQAGLEGGFTTTTISNLENAIDFGGPVDIQQRAGVVVGGFVRFPANDAFALETGLLYATKGASPTDGTNELKIQLAYLDVPVLAHWQPSPSTPLYVVFGPSFNFNVSAKTIDVIPTEQEVDAKDMVKDVEVSLVAGAGVTFGKGFLEGRYSAGLTDIADDVNLTATIKNRGFTVLVGVRF